MNGHDSITVGGIVAVWILIIGSTFAYLPHPANYIVSIALGVGSLVALLAWMSPEDEK